MDLKIKIDKRNNGKYYHKTIRNIDSSKTRLQASNDISDYCKESGSLFSKNYLILESFVVKYNSLYPENLSIDTCFL